MYLSDTHIQVREMARDFADGAIRPIAEALDRDERFPEELYAEMGGLGLFGICVPEEMGGPGFDTVAYAVVMEELSRGYASVADQCGLVELISTLLVRHGTEVQRARWLDSKPSAMASRAARCRHGQPKTSCRQRVCVHARPSAPHGNHSATSYPPRCCRVTRATLSWLCLLRSAGHPRRPLVPPPLVRQNRRHR